MRGQPPTWAAYQIGQRVIVALVPKNSLFCPLCLSKEGFNPKVTHGQNTGNNIQEPPKGKFKCGGKKHCRPLLAQGIEQMPISPQRQSHPGGKGGASGGENLCGKGTHRGTSESAEGKDNLHRSVSCLLCLRT